jgi:hypothetical protein
MASLFAAAPWPRFFVFLLLEGIADDDTTEAEPSSLAAEDDSMAAAFVELVTPAEPAAGAPEDPSIAPAHSATMLV